MKLVIHKNLVTFAPASNTITLVSPFDQVLETDILRIRDDTSGEVLYDRNFPRNKITVSNGVISYTYDNAHQAAEDDIQVELEFGYYAPKINVFSSQVIDASATLAASSKIYVDGADSIWIDANNTGASTSLTVNVYPYMDADAEAGAIIHTATISNTVQATGSIDTGVPYIAIGAVNSDASNAASLNATLFLIWK